MTSVARVATTVISIHALLAESDVGQKRLRQKLAISIHALLAESDSDMSIVSTFKRTFLSTLSLRRATVHYDNYNLHCVISIHALLAESDKVKNTLSDVINHFYPRSPCGERQSVVHQSGGRSGISIHALLAESDIKVMEIGVGCLIFLSTLSLRRATKRASCYRAITCISIHALLAESDQGS